MTLSITQQIVAAAVALLGGSGKPAGVAVTQYRTLQLSKAQCPSMSVYSIRDEQLVRVGLEDAPVSDRRFTFCVECRVVGEPIDLNLDPLIVWAVQALNSEVRLGGLTNGLQQTEITWASGDLDAVYGGARVDFTAHYSVLAADPTAQF